MDKRRVVITGLGTVNPLGNNVADSWAAARAENAASAPSPSSTPPTSSASWPVR